LTGLTESLMMSSCAMMMGLLFLVFSMTTLNTPSSAVVRSLAGQNLPSCRTRMRCSLVSPATVRVALGMSVMRRD
jgi:hypothetical protein